MKKLTFLLIASLFYVIGSAQGYSVGDKAIDFKLKNVDGKNGFRQKDYASAKGFYRNFYLQYMSLCRKNMKIVLLN
jgi:hypothetical protein